MKTLKPARWIFGWPWIYLLVNCRFPEAANNLQRNLFRNKTPASNGTPTSSGL
jgi:hypothetical protein